MIDGLQIKQNHVKERGLAASNYINGHLFYGRTIRLMETPNMVRVVGLEPTTSKFQA